MVQNLQEELSRSDTAREQTPQMSCCLKLPMETAWPPAAPQRGAQLPQLLKFLPSSQRNGEQSLPNTFLVTDMSWWGTGTGDYLNALWDLWDANLNAFCPTVEQPKSLTSHKKPSRQMHVHNHRLVFNQLWKYPLKFRSVQRLHSQQMPQAGVNTHTRDL